MRQKHLVNELINIRDEMKHINNRIKTNSSTKNHEFISHQNTNFKIRKYCHQLIQIKPPQFFKYFISEYFLLDLLEKSDYEKILKITLKFIVKHFQDQELYQKYDNQYQSNEKNAEKINKIIKEVVSPIKSKIESQTQFYDQQLKINHRSCQTQPCYSESQQVIQFNLGLRQQSSIISSIQQDNLNSPKFNENTINAIDEISFEKSCIKKGSENQIGNHTKQNQLENNEKKHPYSVSLLSTPKQNEFDNKKQGIFNNNNITVRETKRKEKHKTSLEFLTYDKQDEINKIKKQLPSTMLSLDFIKQRKKIPESKKGSNILSNY
ncbi:unnamed protein product [Paramecium pentaurelia]|uniref:Uncharacterized protein n=1 Tax=Paramecium pentaurelia TaxID=43138 RepID=A0A8S1X785_9CILI|nr:unnamed protein product [Paramecium pentaurelia]